MNDKLKIDDLKEIDGPTDVVVYGLLCALLSEMKELRDEVGKSDRGRYISVSITDTEKVISFWSTYVLENKANGWHTAN